MDWLSNLFGGIGDAAKGAGNSIGGLLNNLFGGGGSGNASGSEYTGAQKMTQAMGAPNQMSFGAAPQQAATVSGGMNPGMIGAGLGTLGLGQLFQPKVKAPDFGGLQSVQNLQNFNSTPHPLDPAIQQSIQDSLNIQNEQQLRNLRDTYKNARPGTDYTTDSAYQRDLANLNRNMSMTGSDAMANASLQSNQQQLGNLTNLAGLQSQGAMTQYGQQAQKAQNQNQMFGNLGSMFLQKGLGIPNFGNLAGLFGSK